MKSPTPAEIRKARERAKLSRADAAKLIYVSPRTWEKYELGTLGMAPAYWELWRLKVASE